MDRASIKKWIEYEGVNTFQVYNLSLNERKNYRIAAIIPQEIIEYMQKRYTEYESGIYLDKYFGAELSINEDSTGTEYFVVGYFYLIEIDGTIEFSRLSFYLNDYSVNYEKYLKSKEFIKLDITLENLKKNFLDFRQAIAYDNVYASSGYSLLFNELNEIDVNSSSSYIYSTKKQRLYQNIYYNDTVPGSIFTGIFPTYIANKIGITPSILEFAKKALLIPVDKGFNSNNIKRNESKVRDRILFA